MEPFRRRVPGNVEAAASTAHARRQARVVRAGALVWARNLGPAEDGLVVQRRPSARELWEAAGVSRSTWMAHKLSQEEVHADLREAAAVAQMDLALPARLRPVPDAGEAPGPVADPLVHEVLLGAAAALAAPFPEPTATIAAQRRAQAAHLLAAACWTVARADVLRVDVLGAFLTRLEAHHATLTHPVPVAGDRVLWVRGFLRGAGATRAMPPTPLEGALAARVGDPQRYQEGWVAGAVTAGRWGALERTVDTAVSGAPSPTAAGWGTRDGAASVAEVLLGQLTLACVAAREGLAGPGPQHPGAHMRDAGKVCGKLARQLLPAVPTPTGQGGYLDRLAGAFRATVTERWDDVLDHALAASALIRPGAVQEHGLDDLALLAWHAAGNLPRREDRWRRKLLARHLRAEVAKGRGPFLTSAARRLAHRIGGARDPNLAHMMERAVTPRLLADMSEVTRTLQVARAFNVVPGEADVTAAHARLDVLAETLETMRAQLPPRP